MRGTEGGSSKLLLRLLSSLQYIVMDFSSFFHCFGLDLESFDEGDRLGLI